MVAQPETLPVPNDFPFQWDSPEEATRLWMLDMMHWPHGLSPLSATMDMPAFMRGFTKAARELSMPFTAMQTKVIHGWVYMNVEPYSTEPAEMERRMADMQGQMGKHIPGLLDRWHTLYEPEVRSINDETLKGDHAKLTDNDLSALLEAIVKKREREGELHMLAVFPAMGAVMFYEQVYTQLFGEPRAGDHLQLLQGFENKSVEAGVGLWQLAREARKRPEVLATLRSVASGEADEALAQSEQGRAFRGAVREYLSDYGWRANEMDLAEPTWCERPAPVYTLIREYAAREDYDPEGEFRSLVSARKAREEVLFRQLAGGPIDMFQQVLGGAQQYLPIQEDHNFYIDQVGLSVQRVPSLEAGRRLAAGGRIANAEDVFFLHYDELQDALRGGKGDLTELVERRRSERAEGQALTAPPALGTPPPPELGDDPMLGKFFGAPPEKHPDPRIINGNAASAGKITGTARVITSLNEADRLGQGEILVCPATMPPWTPLFAIASGVVTDHGGVLSHTAIVAREYQIPAVIGTKVATSLIRDGQTVTVDGSEGTVKMED
jgi:phosphohistidine swiveling domain-containing protein